MLDDIAALKPIPAEPPLHELLKSLEPITWSNIAPKFEVFGEARRPARKQSTTPGAGSAAHGSQRAISPAGAAATGAKASHKEELELPGWAAAGTTGKAGAKGAPALDQAATNIGDAADGGSGNDGAQGEGGDGGDDEDLDDAQLLVLHEAQLDLMRRDWKAKQEVKERRRNRQHRTPSAGGPSSTKRRRDRKR